MESCRKCKSSNPRDMLYGIIGLASDVGQETFAIDYNKPLPELQLELIDFLHSKSGNQESHEIESTCRMVRNFFRVEMKTVQVYV